MKIDIMQQQKLYIMLLFLLECHYMIQKMVHL